MFMGHGYKKKEETMKATLKMRDTHFSTSEQTATRQGQQDGDQGGDRGGHVDRSVVLFCGGNSISQANDWVS